jgi:hypothetical protein
MERLFNNITENLKVVLSVPSFQKLKFFDICHIEAVYFKNKIFIKEFAFELELRLSHFQLFPSRVRISVVTTHKVSGNTCFFSQVNEHLNTHEDLIPPLYLWLAGGDSVDGVVICYWLDTQICTPVAISVHQSCGLRSPVYSRI